MKRLALILLLLSASLATLRGQNLSDLIISEVLPCNDSSVVDAYGARSPWIELLNTSQGAVNFAGCYLSDDPENLRKSMIPKGDAATLLGAGQLVLLYCTGDRSQGTLYLDFVPSPGSEVYLVSSDGRTIIDSIKIPSDLPAGTSVAKFATDIKETQFDDVRPSKPTPGTFNGRHEQRSKSQMMSESDPHGFTLSLIAVLVVFSALIILFLIYNLSGNIFTGKIRFRRPRRQPDPETAAAIALALSMEGNDDAVAAAIAAALHLHYAESVHDTESGIITIQPRNASAWCDNSLNFRKTPYKK